MQRPGHLSARSGRGNSGWKAGEKSSWREAPGNQVKEYGLGLAQQGEATELLQELIGEPTKVAE